MAPYIGTRHCIARDPSKTGRFVAALLFGCQWHSITLIQISSDDLAFCQTTLKATTVLEKTTKSQLAIQTK